MIELVQKLLKNKERQKVCYFLVFLPENFFNVKKYVSKNVTCHNAKCHKITWRVVMSAEYSYNNAKNIFRYIVQTARVAFEER